MPQIDPRTGMFILSGPDQTNVGGPNPPERDPDFTALANPEVAGLGGFLAGGPPGAALAAMGTDALRTRLRGQPFDPVSTGLTGAINAGPGLLGDVVSAASPLLSRVSGALGEGGIVGALKSVLGLDGDAAAADLAGTRMGGSLFKRGVDPTAQAGRRAIISRATDFEGSDPILAQKLEDIVSAIQQGQPAPQGALLTLTHAGLSPASINRLISMRIGAAGNAGLAIRSATEPQQ